MKNKNRLIIITLITISIFSNLASSAVDDGSRIVKLRTSCNENGIEIANCFESTGEVLSWIKTINLPNVVSPLLVDIGPGIFDGIVLSCNEISNINFRGAGMTKTIIGKSNQVGVQMSNCENMNFQDMTVKGGSFITIYWIGDGSSVWTNVEVIGGLYAWTETGCGATPQGTKHYWFNSRIHASGKTAYLAACSENWFFGTEIINEGFGAGTSSTLIVRAANGEDTYPEIHLYGSVLRNIMPAGQTYTPIAATVGKNGELHIHGTGIDVIGNELPNDIIAFNAKTGGVIHASQSAFVMKTAAGGKAIRIKDNGGTVKAPYLWEKEIMHRRQIEPYPFQMIPGFGWMIFQKSYPAYGFLRVHKYHLLCLYIFKFTYI